MNTFISMLRGINVSGQKRVLMPELKALYESLGFTQATTYVQSGNVVFDFASQDESIITAAIELGIVRHFSFPVSVILRNKEDFRRILDTNPFINQRNLETEKLYVTFLSAIPAAMAVNKLKISPDHADEFIVNDKEVYLFCPGGYGRTKLSNNFFEKKLEVSATTRNWKTVLALYNIASSRKNAKR